MRKGEKVFLTEDCVNAIYWEDLGNGFSLIARPNFKSLSVKATEQIETSDEDVYKNEDIDYCLKNLSSVQLSVENFLQEVNDIKLTVKNKILKVLKNVNIVEPFDFDDICNATEILMISEQNIELLDLYMGLSKLLNRLMNESIFSVCKIIDKANNTVEYILMDKTVENNIYTDTFNMSCVE